MKEINASYVYCIINLETGNKYVGSTTRVASRKRQHVYMLRKGCHRSALMQKDFIKYGESSMKFVVLEKVMTFDQDELFKREQYWINKYSPAYNTNPLAGNHFPPHALVGESKKKSVDKRRGRIQSEEERKMRSVGFAERWADPKWRKKLQKKLKKTPEQKERFRQLATGEHNGNWGKKRPEHFKKLISNLFSSVEYVYVSPSGKEVVFRNLGLFCRESGLNYNTMKAMHQGNRKSEYLGWTFKSKRFIGYNKEETK